MCHTVLTVKRLAWLTVPSWQERLLNGTCRYCNTTALMLLLANAKCQRACRRWQWRSQPHIVHTTAASPRLIWSRTVSLFIWANVGLEHAPKSLHTNTASLQTINTRKLWDLHWTASGLPGKLQYSVNVLVLAATWPEAQILHLRGHPRCSAIIGFFFSPEIGMSRGTSACHRLPASFTGLLMTSSAPLLSYWCDALHM